VVHPNTSTTRSDHKRAPRIPVPFSLTIHEAGDATTARAVSHPGCQGRSKTARFRPVENCAVQWGWLVSDLLSFATEPLALASDNDDRGVAEAWPWRHVAAGRPLMGSADSGGMDPLSE